MCTSASQTKPIQLPLQYLGKWHEIQRLSNSFQKGQCSTATYSLQSPEVVGVLNKELLWVLQCLRALWITSVIRKMFVQVRVFVLHHFSGIHVKDKDMDISMVLCVVLEGQADLCPLSPALQSLLGFKISFTINGYSSNLRLHLKNILGETQFRFYHNV